MTSYELISVISLIFTSLIAVSTFLIPLIINQINNRRKEKKEELEKKQANLEKLYEEKRKEFEFIFEEEYKIICDFDNAYYEWTKNKNNENFIKAIYQAMSYFHFPDYISRCNFIYLLNSLKNNYENDKCDREYENCRNTILGFLGIGNDENTSKDIIKVKLRRALRKKLGMTQIY